MRFTTERRGIVHIVRELCKGCGICIWICPRKVLEFSEEVNKFGWKVPKAKNGCIGCKLCEMYCPDLAIWVEVIEQ